MLGLMLGQVGAQRIERVRSRGRFEAAHETGLLRGDEAKGILWIGPVVHGPFEAFQVHVGEASRGQ